MDENLRAHERDVLKCSSVIIKADNGEKAACLGLGIQGCRLVHLMPQILSKSASCTPDSIPNAESLFGQLVSIIITNIVVLSC